MEGAYAPGRWRSRKRSGLPYARRGALCLKTRVVAFRATLFLSFRDLDIGVNHNMFIRHLKFEEFFLSIHGAQDLFFCIGVTPLRSFAEKCVAPICIRNKVPGTGDDGEKGARTDQERCA